MELAAKIGNFSETLLLTPPGKVTLIEKEDLSQLDLRVFDRIALHRSYMVIHEAIVLQVNATTCEIVVLERTKEGGPVSKGTVQVHKINLYAENGQLYRYDDRPTEADMPDILKRVLDYYGTEGYNVLSYNCQHLSSSIRHGNENSHQTWWMILKMVLDFCSHTVIPLFAEKFENDNGGMDIIGVKASACLHLGFFVAECVVALIKVFRGRMSWKDFVNVMTRQLLMHLFGLAGNSIQLILGECVAKFAVACVFAFCGYLVADAILPDRASSGYDKYIRQALIIDASVISFFAVEAMSSWLLEAFVAMIGGYGLTFIGHLLFHGIYISWSSKENVSGEWIQNLADLYPGDHITIYRNCLRRYSHAIFLRASGNNMVVIRNSRGRGVIKEEVKFKKGWVYRYNYPSSEVRSAQEVVAVAQSKIGEGYRYNYNGRSFAKLCKRKHTGSGESNAVSIDSVFDSIESDESLSKEERERLIDKFEKLKSQMPTFYTEDAGTTQDPPRQSGSQHNEVELVHEASAPLEHESRLTGASTRQRMRFALV